MRARAVVLVFLGVGLAVAGLALRPRRPALPPEIETGAVAARAHLQRARAEARVPLLPEEGARRAAEERRAGRTASAWDLLAAASSPDDPGSELRAVILALEVPMEDRLPQEEARALVGLIAHEHADAPLVPAARAWAALSEKKPADALVALSRDQGTAEGALARLRAVTALGQSPLEAAEALLDLDPASGEACAVIARSALAEGALARLVDRGIACQAAGVQDAALVRALGDALDVSGRSAEAYDAYVRAGITLHAAAIVTQEGLPDPARAVDAALIDPAPPAGLAIAWIGLLRGDSAIATGGAKRLIDAGFPGPEAVLARAAVAIAGGDPAAAVRLLGDSGSAQASTLLGRAYAQLGDQDRAATAFAEALRLAPTQVAVHRERLAWLAGRPSERALAAARALVEVDPISLTLASLSRDRDAPWAAVAPSAWPSLPGASTEAALLSAVLEPLAEPGAALTGEDLALAQVHRAYAMARAGQIEDARRIAESAASALPRLVGPRIVAAELARVAGDREGAHALLARAEQGLTEDAPERVAFLWVRARLESDRGERVPALTDMNEAARSLPDCVALWGALLALQQGGSIPDLGPARLTASLGSTR